MTIIKNETTILLYKKKYKVSFNSIRQRKENSLFKKIYERIYERLKRMMKYLILHFRKIFYIAKRFTKIPLYFFI